MGRAKGNRRISTKTPKEKEAKGSFGSGSGSKSGKTGMRRDVVAVVLLALGLTLGLALATFSALDGQLIARGLPPASNLVGPVGHKVAAAFYGVLGFAALVLPVALCTASVRLFRAAPLRITLIAAGAYAALTASVSTLAQLLLAGQKLASFSSGGHVGAFFARHGESLFSSAGTSILALTCATVALIVAADFKVQRAAGLAAAGASAFFGFVGGRLQGAVDRHREAVAELRAEEAEERALREVEEAEAAAEDEAVVEAAEDEAEQEGRAVARALAAEAARRVTFGEDPAWAQGISAPDPAEDEAPPEAEGRRKKRKPKAEAEQPPAPPALEASPAEPPLAEPVAATDEPAGPLRPEIVVPAAMQERGKKKKREEPAFAFTQSGEVFRLPGVDLLDAREVVQKDVDAGGLQKTAEVIVATLRQHGVDGTIRHIRPGPVVTLYEFIPVAGVKLAKIENLDKELTLALSAMRIRIIAPIPGKGVVGIEVPNKDRITVYLRDVLESETFAQAGGFLPLALGKNIEGAPACVDLQRMPHLLIAGTTGSGKSVGLNTMILSLLYRQTPDQVRMIMVDPKMTELSIYEDIPHLLLPVVTDPQKAARALQWAVDEMERRTQMLADTGSKDLKSYNAKIEKRWTEKAGEADVPVPAKKLLVVDVTVGETEEEAAAKLAAESAAAETVVASASAPFEDPIEPPPDPATAEAPAEPPRPKKLPYIVVVIDELADLMMTAPREVEISLARLAQKARATGIHLIVATQRPSTDVVTGMVKNNFPARITFRLASRHDSMTIINGPGAEALLGDGDMLLLTATAPLTRVQGAFVSEEEIARVVGFLKEQGRPVYDPSILKSREEGADHGRDSDDDDPTYDQAIELVSRMEEVSVSKLQREMRLGYNKAAKIIERMEREGIVGPPNGVKPRQVLIRPVGENSPYPNV
jgi:S-DNA-T family DNA segregation ATPase FtsK/SpoIIIE